MNKTIHILIQNTDNVDLVVDHISQGLSKALDFHQINATVRRHGIEKSVSNDVDNIHAEDVVILMIGDEWKMGDIRKTIVQELQCRTNQQDTRDTFC